MRILLTGAAGSGTTTLGVSIAQAINARHFEADDYLWLPTHPPYQKLRQAEERASMLLSALSGAPDAVVSGSVMGWGSAIEDCFDTVVFLYVETGIRIERLIEREQRQHGSARPEFLEWAASYDGNPAMGRSLTAHREWLGTRRSKVIEVVGPHSNEERLEQFLSALALKESA